MLRLLNSKRKEPEDRLAEPRETRKWLSALPACDPLGTCAEITNTLREAKANFVEFTTERNSAVLLVDALSAPLQGALLEDYAAGAHCDHDRGQQIVATLSALNHAFGAYYEALIDSLRTMAPNRDYRSQTYMMLTRRLAHLRYDVVLSAMRYEKWIPLRWEKTHRLYRLAMQQSLHEVGATGGRGWNRHNVEWLLLVLVR